MRETKTQKQAYVAPVVRSVAFKVERGFAGSNEIFTTPINPTLENVSYSSNNYGSHDFSFSFGSTSNND